MGWWAPGTRWFSSNERIAIAGVPLQTVDQTKATREEYLRYLRCVVQQFDLNVNVYEPVTNIETRRDGFVVTSGRGRGESRYLATRIVLATGGTAAPRKLNVPGEDLPHVSHYMGEPHKYFRTRVLVVGGRNSAVEAALRLHQVGARVAISYRRSEFDAKSIKYWLMPEITGLIKAGRIEAHFNTVVRSMDGEGVELVRCGADFVAIDGEVKKIPADFVLLLVGYVADMSLARMAGVELRGEQEVPVYDGGTMETNVPGVYIAGTAVAGTQGRYKVFLENCHVHVDRIVNAITGRGTPVRETAAETVVNPES
jgi:thioredoxin reductase (NADPH)